MAHHFIGLDIRKKSKINYRKIVIREHPLEVNSCICGELVDELPLAQQMVSQYFKELKTSGLVKGNVVGNTICYCINDKAKSTLQNYFLTKAMKLKENKKECCGEI